MKDTIFQMKAREYGISPLPENPKVAMAYVPYQNAEKIYSAEQGMCSGTMFPCLDKPFHGNKCCQIGGAKR